MYFQRNCAQSEAHYTLKPDGEVDVFNRCLTSDWQWEEARGTATPQVPGKTDKLWVEFDNWFSRIVPGVAKGQYWVLYVSDDRSEEHTSELQSLMRISYAVFCLKKKKTNKTHVHRTNHNLQKLTKTKNS